MVGTINCQRNVTKEHIDDVLGKGTANLYNCFFGEGIFEYFLQQLEGNSIINTLNLGSCNIDSEMIIKLADIL